MGRKQQSIGKYYENLVDLSLREYKRTGRAIGQTNNPKITINRWPNARVVGKAQADRTVTLAEFGGRTCHIEIKTWENKDKRTVKLTGSKSAVSFGKQYQRIRETVHFEALALYLVCWRHSGNEEWRLHPFGSFPADADELVFVREDGFFVDSSQGWPDWLEAI